MNKELLEALNVLEKEKEINKEAMFVAIENSLCTALARHFGKNENKTYTNIIANVNRETGDFEVYAEKTVVEEVLDPVTDITLADAKVIDADAEIGSVVRVDVSTKEFGRIAASNAKNVITQKLREEERNAVYKKYNSKEKQVVTGVVQRFVGKNVSIDLGKAEGFLTEAEQVPSEHLKINQRIKVFVIEVKDSGKGARINVSRTHPELVRKLFEQEVSEIADGTVVIKSIAREAGSRSKISVYSNNPDVDPVGACVGMNGARVNAIVAELNGEKIDIVNWDENPGYLIENALSPAKVLYVFADGEEKSAKVVVPDNQLSLAIGKEGQNARLAAKLTGFKIDIKSETQAKDAVGFRITDYTGEDYDEEAYDEEYAETVEDVVEE